MPEQCWLQAGTKALMGLTKARNNYGDQTAFTMELLIRYTDGTTESVYTDPSWKGCDSPVVFAEIYDGETYDAALEIPDWSKAETTKGDWKRFSLYSLIHRLCARSTLQRFV